MRDMCYRCGGSGRIDPEDAHALNLERVAGAMARAHIADLRKAYNNDPEGDGWAFNAAENMLSESDYTAARERDAHGSFIEELSKLDRKAQDALVALLFPPPAPKAATPVPGPEAPAPADDEIPF